MTIKHFFTAVLCSMLYTAQAQDNNCNVLQAQLDIYDFVLKNLDSIQKHTKASLMVASVEVGDSGDFKKVTYYTGFNTKNQKEVKVWRGLSDNIKTVFSRCPGSHFHDGETFVNKTDMQLPLMKETVATAIKKLKADPAYVPLENFSTLPENSKYKVNIRQLSISGEAVAARELTGTMKKFNSEIQRIDEKFHIIFKIDKIPGHSGDYLLYKIFDAENPSRPNVVMQEKWRPILNNKVHVVASGERDAGKNSKPGKFNLVIDFTFE